MLAFTELTGAVVHIAIGGIPNIITALVLCVAFALIGARVSALFANKVDAKKQNQVTGASLCALGVVLACVNWFF